MASIGHFAQSYITNLYDKQKKKKLPADWGGGGTCPPPPPVVTPLLKIHLVVVKFQGYFFLSRYLDEIVTF